MSKDKFTPGKLAKKSRQLLRELIRKSTGKCGSVICSDCFATKKSGDSGWSLLIKDGFIGNLCPECSEKPHGIARENGGTLRQWGHKRLEELDETERAAALEWLYRRREKIDPAEFEECKRLLDSSSPS